MPDETTLSPEAKLAVRSEVERTIAKIAAVFGIANVAVLAGAIWVMWGSITSETATISESVKRDILGDLSSNRTELNAAVNKAHQLIGKLEQSQTDMNVIETSIDRMQDDLAQLGDGGAISEAAAFLQAWKGATDASDVIDRVDGLVGLRGCTHPRLFGGQTSPDKTHWQEYNGQNYAATTVVDTSDADFSTAPIYLASLGGDDGHWYVAGTSSIYRAKADSFSIFVRWLDAGHGGKNRLVDYARRSKWHINWLAIGC